jgi:hypothetical protein
LTFNWEKGISFELGLARVLEPGTEAVELCDPEDTVLDESIFKGAGIRP